MIVRDGERGESGGFAEDDVTQPQCKETKWRHVGKPEASVKLSMHRFLRLVDPCQADSARCIIGSGIGELPDQGLRT